MKIYNIVVILLLAFVMFPLTSYAQECNEINYLKPLIAEHNLPTLRGRLISRGDNYRAYISEYVLPNSDECEITIYKPDQSQPLGHVYECVWNLPEKDADLARSVLIQSLELCGLTVTKAREGTHSIYTLFSEETIQGSIEHITAFKVSLKLRVDRYGNQELKFEASHDDWR